MGKLSATQVRAIKEAGRYSDGDGLMLHVSENGSASWLLRIQVGKRRREFGLGSLKKVGLAAACEKAEHVRKQFAAGLDPVVEKKKAQRVIPTFKVAAEAVHAENKKSWSNGKHRDQWLNTLETYAFPTIGSLTVDTIDGPVIRDVLLPIWLEKPETARRVRQRIGAVMDWAFASGFRSTELTTRLVSKGLPRQPKKDGHFAAMPFADVPNFLVRLQEVETMGRLALLATLFTACRSGEVRGARWSELDMGAKVWAIPKERMKAKVEHRVPLSDQAIRVFERAAELRIKGSDLIFYGQQPRRPLSDMTLLKVLRDMKLPFTVHGFRSSFADWAAEQTKFPQAVVDAVLAHTVDDKVLAAYRRTDFFEKRRQLLQAWGNYLDQPKGAVLAFPAGRKRNSAVP